MSIFIFDYCSGQVFRHAVLDSEMIEGWEDTLFENICKENGIRSKDCYYMITENEQIIQI